jgi:hypothetical protein
MNDNDGEYIRSSKLPENSQLNLSSYAPGKIAKIAINSHIHPWSLLWLFTGMVVWHLEAYASIF